MSSLTLAQASDGQEMLALLEAGTAPGLLELVYTRRPDAFLALKKENPAVKIAVLKDAQGLAVQGYCLPQRLYLNGRPHQIGYFGGVRKRPGFRETGWLKRMVGFAQKQLALDYYYTSILQTNHHAQAVFEKKRSYLTSFKPLTTCTTYIFNPRVWQTQVGADYRLIQAKPSNWARGRRFIQTHASKHDFYPVLEHWPNPQLADLALSDGYFLTYKKQLVAYGALWDQTGYKQYLVKAYHGWLKPLTYWRSLPAVFGYIKLPPTATVFPLAQVALLLIKDDNPEFLRQFLAALKAADQRFNIWVIGMNDHSRLASVLASKKALSFQNQIYLVALNSNQVQVDPRRFHFECALV